MPDTVAGHAASSQQIHCQRKLFVIGFTRILAQRPTHAAMRFLINASPGSSFRGLPVFDLRADRRGPSLIGVKGLESIRRGHVQSEGAWRAAWTPTLPLVVT